MQLTQRIPELHTCAVPIKDIDLAIAIPRSKPRKVHACLRVHGADSGNGKTVMGKLRMLHIPSSTGLGLVAWQDHFCRSKFAISYKILHLRKVILEVQDQVTMHSVHAFHITVLALIHLIQNPGRVQQELQSNSCLWLTIVASSVRTYNPSTFGLHCNANPSQACWACVVSKKCFFLACLAAAAFGSLAWSLYCIVYLW